jgi:hypothetical protein
MRGVRLISVIVAVVIMVGLGVGFNARWYITVPLGILVYLVARFIGASLFGADNFAKK